MTQRLALASARHPMRTILIWVAACLLAVAAVALLLGDALTSEAEVTNNPESYQGYDLMNERLAATRTPETDPLTTDVLLIRSSTLAVGDPAFRQKVDALRAELRATPGVLNVADEPAAQGDRALAISLGLGGEEAAESVIELVERADEEPFDVTTTGEWIVDRDFNKLSQSDLQEGELKFGLPVALIVLLLVFGAVVAGLIPLLLAIVAILTALGLTALVGSVTDLSLFVVNMLTGMGLALGIDYSLFVVSRFREERSGGREKLDAIAASGATASRAVVFSGIAFALAMLGMVLVPDTILRSLALGAILVALTSVAASLTLLPAVLSLLGDRVNSLKVPYVGRNAERGSGAEGRFWTAIVRWVMRRPVVSLVAGTAFLLALAAPVLTLETGQAGIRTIPDSYPSKAGFIALEQEFGVGTTDTVEVVVDGTVGEPATRAGVEQLADQLRDSPSFRQVSVEYHEPENLAVVEALPIGDSRDEAAFAAVRQLRDQEIPGARVLVTGETAEAVDYLALTDKWLPIVLLFVLTMSFILLTIAFRSLVVPAKAILLNLLSVGAAYGLMVLVFQEGIGNEIFGFQKVEAIEAWVPLFLFAVLFGLSMDYHVFLLSRIRERYGQTGDNDEAVAHGIGTTARLITGAALIIIAVFSGFARGDLVMFQQMGFGVAVALLLDATIVRSVILPASMKLLGDRNWYLPRWLDWLPNLQVEGPKR